MKALTLLSVGTILFHPILQSVHSVKQIAKTVDRPKESTASGTPLGPIAWR